MKKLLTMVLFTSLMLTLVACANKNEVEQSTVINAGDSAGSKDSTESTTEVTDEKVEATEKVEEDAEKVVEEDKNTIYGVWSAEDGSIYQFSPMETVDGEPVEDVFFGMSDMETGESISGTCLTDHETYIDVTYLEYVVTDNEGLNIDEDGNVIVNEAGEEDVEDSAEEVVAEVNTPEEKTIHFEIVSMTTSKEVNNDGDEIETTVLVLKDKDTGTEYSLTKGNMEVTTITFEEPEESPEEPEESPEATVAE